MAKMISAKSDVVSRNGSASERIPASGALHLAGDHQQVGRVARKPVNGRGDDNIAGGEVLQQFFKLRPVGRGAGDLLAEHLFASGRLELARRRHSRKSCFHSASEICIEKAQLNQPHVLEQRLKEYVDRLDPRDETLRALGADKIPPCAWMSRPPSTSAARSG
jgi:hypothetical protein